MLIEWGEAMQKRPKGIFIFLEDSLAIAQLTLEERGRLFTAILDYANGCIVDNLTGSERILWPIYQSRIDEQLRKYEETCKRNANNRRGGDKS